MIAADHDADVRRAGRHRAEEDEIAGLEPVAIDGLADAKLFAHFPRHGDAVLLIYIADEAAAIEAAWIDAAETVRRAAQRQCGSRECITI